MLGWSKLPKRTRTVMLSPGSSIPWATPPTQAQTQSVKVARSLSGSPEPVNSDETPEARKLLSRRP